MAPDSAFTALYDEHASRIYTYCLRLTGSRDDAADALQDAFTGLYARLDAGGAVEHPRAYLFAVARHAGLRRLGDTERALPVRDVPEVAAGADVDGERSALIEDVRADVREVERALPVRHREILALREVEELPYAQIGPLMGLSENGAAQLAWRARAALRTGLRGKALRSIAPLGEACERALTLLELRDDGELPAADSTWLDQHLTSCERCTANRAAMLELGTTYRAALPLAAVPLVAEKALAAASAATSPASRAVFARRAPAAVAVGVVVAVIGVAGWLGGALPGAGADDPSPAVSAPAERAPAPSSSSAAAPGARGSSGKLNAKLAARTRAKKQRAVARRRAARKRAMDTRRHRRSASERARSGGAPSGDIAASRQRPSGRAPGQAPSSAPVASVPAVPAAPDAEPATPATRATPVPGAPAIPATPAVPADPACIPGGSQVRNQGGHSC